jgi:hypothetical protein
MHRLVATRQFEFEELLAELTDTVYRVALQHGINGSFLEIELDLWAALRCACARHQSAAAPAGTSLSGARVPVQDTPISQNARLSQDP